MTLWGTALVTLLAGAFSYDSICDLNPRVNSRMLSQANSRPPQLDRSLRKSLSIDTSHFRTQSFGLRVQTCAAE